jgi:hypothetical protein
VNPKGSVPAISYVSLTHYKHILIISKIISKHAKMSIYCKVTFYYKIQSLQKKPSKKTAIKSLKVRVVKKLPHLTPTTATYTPHTPHSYLTNLKLLIVVTSKIECEI